MLRFKATEKHGLPTPARATAGAAGYDLMNVEAVTLAPGQQRLMTTGFAVAIPHGFVGLIRDRSGMAYKCRLTTRAGVIDSDYRGAIGVILVNESGTPQEIKPGTRIAQLIVMPCYMGDSCEVDDLGDTSRGAGGFGSTGR